MIGRSPVQVAMMTFIAMSPVLAWSQMLSPGGYTGVMNTPTAAVRPLGNAALSVSNSNPEVSSLVNGPSGSLNFGLGLLPGLEAVGRLAFEGNVNCNMFESSCKATQRDLSFGAKYQLPITLWNDTKVALGVSDVGGAATNFRHYYGVATSRWQSLETSVGYSKAVSQGALLNGAFGGVRYSVLPQLQLLAEYDSRNTRAGVQYQQRLGQSADLTLALSRKLSGSSSQQANQIQLALNFDLDRSASGARPATRQTERVEPTAPTSLAPQRQDVKAWVSAPAQPAVPSAGVSAMTATELAHVLEQAGFANIEVQHWPAQAQQAGVWRVRAEARAYRQSHVEAIGQALRPWLAALRQQRVNDKDQWDLTLTYQREPIVYARAHGQCLDQWVRGEVCGQSTATPVVVSSRPIEPAPTETQRAEQAPQIAEASAGPAWAPQLALSPALRSTVGTEYGLADYSLAAQLGVEVGFLPGLFWQGIYLVPVKNSDDYEAGKVFGSSRFAKSQLHSSQLTYWRPLIWGVKAQISAGQLTPTDKGSQFDAIWNSPDGRWRASYTGGRYNSELIQRQQVPEFVQLRYSVIPGQWQVEGTTGTFMASDKGYKLASVHWFGDTRFALQYQRTGNLSRANLPHRSFLGFNISVPMGPKAATPIGPVTVRGQDRWNWGLQTKVGEGDNKITVGYGDFPRQRHGLWSDVIDHDRNGDADLAAQLPRLRGLLVQ